MPWKATDQMKERARFVMLADESDESFAELCRQFRISRQTGYKWFKRVELEGFEGLLEKKRAPRHAPHRTPQWKEDEVVLLRKTHPTWGPKKLRTVLADKRPDEQWPAVSTIGEILNRKGLVRPRRRRLRTAWSGTEVEGAKFPNDVWAIDFKGHFGLKNGQRCHPLTLTDLYSRFLLKCEGLQRETWEPVKAQLELTFREFGLPQRLRSDNGGPFSSLAPGGLCHLAVWLVQLGVTPERIRPRQPQENGSHERMHRTLKAEATKPPQEDFITQQRAFDDFRAVFNNERPHEALGQRHPRSLYTLSARSFPALLRQPEYPANFLVRKTNWKGTFSFKSQDIATSRTLPNADVGMKPIDEDRWQVFYGPLTLGFLDARDGIRMTRQSPT